VLPSIRPAATSLLLCTLAGCTTPEEFSPQQLAYCTQLYELYFRYHTVISFAHVVKRSQAELALHACEQGDYAAGIEVLTTLLTRERVTVPPPPSGSGM
jgi:hypothetical protein